LNNIRKRQKERKLSIQLSAFVQVTLNLLSVNHLNFVFHGNAHRRTRRTIAILMNESM